MSRRLKQFRISPGFVAMLGMGDFHRHKPMLIFGQIPETATVVRSGYDFMKDQFVLVLSDESFEEVPREVEIPEIEPTFLYDAFSTKFTLKDRL